MRRQDQLSQLLDEFCALVFSVLRASSGPGSHTLVSGVQGRGRLRASPAGLVSLLLGISTALIFCGSVTFMIGFVLMPWVLGLAMVLHFVGMLTNLSTMGRSILCPCPSSPMPRRKILINPCLFDYSIIFAILIFFPHIITVFSLPAASLLGVFPTSDPFLWISLYHDLGNLGLTTDHRGSAWLFSVWFSEAILF